MEVSVSRRRLDRLSELPDSLILRILSLLPMRDVVSTTLLSKRWNNLWTTVPCLNFSESPLTKGIERVRNFVNRVLILWKGVKIQKFEIVIRYPFDMSLAGDIDLWLRFAVKNEVEELNIDLAYDEDEMEWVGDVMKGVYWAPQFLNLYSSIKKLSLTGCNIRIPGSPTWNQLKSLRINGFCLSGHLISRILLGSPQLEVFELRLLEGFGNLNIQSTSLKKLKIEKYFILEEHKASLELDTVLRICCPKLEKLELYGVFFKCLFTNVSSLIDATLGFNDLRYLDMSGNHLLGEALRQILPTIGHVERLGLSVLSAQELGASHMEAALPPLSNVKFLKLIATGDELFEGEFIDTMNLLGIFPNLNILVIEDEASSCYVNPPPFDLEFGTNLSKSFLIQLRTIWITSNLWNSSIFQVIEFLLKYAKTLEKMVIQLHPDYGMSHSQAIFSRAAKKLLSMSRSSPTAKVIFNT